MTEGRDPFKRVGLGLRKQIAWRGCVEDEGRGQAFHTETLQGAHVSDEVW